MPTGKKEEHNVAGIILAGGEGTRLWPLTQHRCKSAVSFGGKYRLIDIPLSNVLNANITNVFVISQYFSTHLHQHILSTYRSDLFLKGGLSLLSPDKTKGTVATFQGTADAIRKNLNFLKNSSADYFLILSSDQLYNMSLNKLIQFMIEKKADMVIASLHVEEAEAKRMGILQIDSASLITKFHEKPKEKTVLRSFVTPTMKYLASMGIYLFRREALFSLLKEEGNDLGYDLIPKQIVRGGNYAYLHSGYWADIGTIESFYKANMALLERKNCLNIFDEINPIYAKPYHLFHSFLNGQIKKSIISQGSIVEAEEINQSILGIRCHLHRGSKIYNSILMGNELLLQHPSSVFNPFSIGENCIINNAIIDEQTYIGNDVRLTNEKKQDHYDGEGVCIRNGIIIVKTGTHLVDGFIL